VKRARVVVTGIGLITPCGFAAPVQFDASGFACHLAAEVRDFDAAPYFRQPKALKLAHRITRFAVAAASMALADAGWPDQASRDQLGVIIGTSGSDPQVSELARACSNDADGRAVTDVPYFAQRVLDGLNPLWLLIGLPNMPSSHVAIQLEARGPNSTVMTDWIAGLQAVGEAADWIAAGDAAAVLAGGADSGVHPFAYAAFERAGLFDASAHQRFIPGEGAAVLLLEDRDRAIARGATIRAEVLASASGLSLAATHRAVHASLAALNIDEPPQTAPAHAGRLGHALAAAGVIDAALAMRCITAPAVVLCDAAGASRQAATLAFATAAADRSMT
jgi:3-oxoacyl-[acyl-carrier-protein] synthase II